MEDFSHRTTGRAALEGGDLRMGHIGEELPGEKKKKSL